MAQLDKMIDREKSFHQIVTDHKPMQIIPPARLSDEMLEQFRVVMREELNREEGGEMAIVKPFGCVPEIEGHSSLEAEVEHAGKLYKGILYFVKDVE